MSAQENQVNSAAAGGVQGNQEESQPFVIPSNLQALAQFFNDFQEFYKQRRSTGQVAPTPGAAAPTTVATGTSAPTAVAPAAAVPAPSAPMVFSQEFIPDTQLNEVVLPGTSASTMAVLSVAKEATARQRRAPVLSRPPQASRKEARRVAGRIPPPQAAPAEGASESTSDEEVWGLQAVQVNSVLDQAAPEVLSGKKKEKRKHTSKKSKKSRRSESEDDSGTSSSDSDSDVSREEYWGHGEDCVGLPSWAHERRVNSYRKSFNGTLEWKDGSLVPDVKTSTHLSTDFIVGNHLSQRKRDKILNGDFIDMFRLLPPAKLTGKGEKRHSHGKRRYRAPRVERTFDHWLDGFQVFMGVVSAAYPKREMHLVAYMAHVRRARDLAGDTAALNYDEDFRRNASLLSSTRWDLRDQNYWPEHVGPYIDKKPQDSSKSWKTAPRQRRLCWEFNKGVCVRTVCKYSHECEKCLGNHPATACLKGRQPFRGGRGSYNQGPRGGHGAPSGLQGNRQ
ncbi:XP_034966506.1uncharacterized protein LOC118082785 [Podarcis lilfordi]|uniref:XP_034966506.1uncharacterized protein LOC118082785 n=1 Tax=Podarcis lilfordi TaxID=74358 RepID=A0AA35P3Q6_9SAUR|nr:XP_034966506.1uncharacterized protein LOC118082785 [Podarcis lilfordi]